MDHLPSVISSAFPDSTIAKNMSIKRKKATQICIDVLGPAGHKEIIDDIRKHPFSFIIDETTDISLQKCLAVL